MNTENLHAMLSEIKEREARRILRPWWRGLSFLTGLAGFAFLASENWKIAIGVCLVLFSENIRKDL